MCLGYCETLDLFWKTIGKGLSSDLKEWREEKSANSSTVEPHLKEVRGFLWHFNNHEKNMTLNINGGRSALLKCNA